MSSSNPLHYSYASLTAKKIAAMVGAKQETHVLEFKVVKAASMTDEKDKENFARSVSAFANGGGGVILWGVSARKDSENIDVVQSAEGVAQPMVLLSRLQELEPVICSPSVPGVEHRVIKGTRFPSFVATYVPASDSGPHMCMVGSSINRYFVRAGGTSRPMQHFQVADMFGRRARPVLKIEWFVNQTTSYAFSYGVRLVNVGRGAAQAPYLEISVPHPFVRNTWGVDGNRSEGLPIVAAHRGSGWLHAGGMDTIIHPTMHVDVGGVYLGHGNFSEAVKHLKSHCVIDYKAGAVGIEPVIGRLEIPTPIPA